MKVLELTCLGVSVNGGGLIAADVLPCTDGSGVL